MKLALQGGGAWGAYTWGVLDGLLASRRIAIDQISGTSAGALNGAVLAGALAAARGSRRSSGHDQAREALENFWRAVAQPNDLGAMGFNWAPITSALRTSVGQWMWANGLASPYTVQQPGANPLREIIAQHVDVDAIRSVHAPALYITVTSVRTGLPRVISNAEMSIDALAASACLPQLFQAVELDGEAYWDGGYSGNPTLWPLVRHGSASDVILVQLAADSSADTPRDAGAIQRRAGEIMFNVSLVAEMQAIAAIREATLRARGSSPYVDLRLHRIGPPSQELFDAGSAEQRSWAWLTRLRDEGRVAAQQFLKRHIDDLGVTETLDIVKVFQSQRKPRVRVPGGIAAER